MDTTITIKKELRDRLARLKYKIDCKDYNELIIKLLNSFNKGDEKKCPTT